MRKLQKPQLTITDVYKDCVSGVRGDALRNQLKAILPDIQSAENDYSAKATANLLHQVSRQNDVNGISQKVLKKLYTGQMAKKGRPGRHHYNKLLKAVPNKRCPLCAQGRVKTLDHYLPKQYYPALVVTPLNLIPACRDCNTGKLGTYPTCSEEETLHPFFDDVDDNIWLVADVNGSPVTIVFRVAVQAGWSLIKNKRVAHHFKDFELGEMYASYAAEELINIRSEVQDIFDSDLNNGASEVRKYLSRKAKSYRKQYLNTWQAAMFDGLANNVVYCSGGF
jgi:hypothetical protein